MDLQHFRGVDWNAPDSFLTTLRGVSEHWMMATLVDAAYYVMAQDVAGRLAPTLSKSGGTSTTWNSSRSKS